MPTTIQATPYRTIEEEIAAFYIDAMTPTDLNFACFDEYMRCYDFQEEHFLNLGSFRNDNQYNEGY